MNRIFDLKNLSVLLPNMLRPFHNVDNQGHAAQPDFPERSGLCAMLGYILRCWRPHRLTALVILGCIALYKCFFLYFAYSLKFLVNEALQGGSAPIARFLGRLALVSPVIVLAHIVGQWFLTNVRVKIAHDIRLNVFTHLQCLSLEFYARNQSGDILSRFSSDVENLERTISERFMQGVVAVISGAVVVTMLLSLNWMMTLITLVSAAALLPFILRFVPQLRARDYTLSRSGARVLHTVQEHIHAQPIILGFGLHAAMLAEFRERLAHFAETCVQAFFSKTLAETLSLTLMLFLQIFVIVIGIFLTSLNWMSAGALMAFLGLFAVFTSDLYTLFGNVLPHLFRGMASLDRIAELLREEPQVVDAESALPLPPLSQHIRFRNVSFSYTGDTRHLNDVSLTISEGEYLAIVGASRAGKSTLLNLLLRLYDVDSGSITIDGHDVRNVTQESLRAQMSVVFQNTFLFDASLLYNIRITRPDAARGDVDAAVQAAELHEVIAQLPEGYDTLVGENGVRLSGGERQRLAIARALLRCPAVLLLDEVTASLDARSAQAIMATIERLRVGRTVIAVTHDLLAAARADRIAVLHAGRLAACGTHADLLARKGIYAELWQRR